MEEAYEQDAAILVPSTENRTLSVRAHEHYRKSYNADCLLSVPIRNGDETIGVITCERAKQPFSDIDATEIHLVTTLTSARLKELYQKSSWFGIRLARKTRKGLGKLLGFDHTWAKFFGILAIGFTLFATLVPLQYKVNSPAILKTDKIIYLTAPFDGYIDSVSVKPGDIVYKGQMLLSGMNITVYANDGSYIDSFILRTELVVPKDTLNNTEGTEEDSDDEEDDLDSLLDD